MLYVLGIVPALIVFILSSIAHKFKAVLGHVLSVLCLLTGLYLLCLVFYYKIFPSTDMTGSAGEVAGFGFVLFLGGSICFGSVLYFLYVLAINDPYK